MFMLILLVVTVNLLGGFISAQTTVKKEKLQQKHKKNVKSSFQNSVPPDIAIFLNQARLLPPEFYVDLLVRVVESKKISNKEANLDLLKEAFEKTNQVQLKAKKRIFKSINMDTKASYLDKAHDLNLDMISLKCRIVNTLLTIDKNSAKQLFSETSLVPYIKEVSTCEDVAVYDLTTYYETAKKIAEQCFTKDEIKEGFKTNFVQDQISNIVSITQLSHTVKLIESFNWSLLDLQNLLSRYTEQITRLEPNYRDFIGSESLYKTTQSIHNLALYFEKNKVSSKYLVQAYKEYIIKNLSEKICPDGSAKEKLIPQLVFRANLRLFVEEPILIEELDLEEDSSMEESSYFSSKKSKLIFNEMQKLQAYIQKQLSKANQSEETSLKQTDLDDYYSKILEKVRDWKASDEQGEEEYLHQKAIVYQELIQIAQTKIVQKDLLHEYLLFLRDFKLDNTNRAEWLIHLNFVLRMAKNSDDELRTISIKLLQNSQIDVAQLYTLALLKGL